jgi:enamine deaminase RidA (YjgF/YER057c/UK114 family)
MGVEAQIEQPLLNLAAVLAAARSSMDDLLKTTIFYADAEDFVASTRSTLGHMPDPPQARPRRPRSAAPGLARLRRGDRGPNKSLDLASKAALRRAFGVSARRSFSRARFACRREGRLPHR